MKLTKKLIPAFAMLLVSAVLMSTASFAWFSMNETVTATGMQVTAKAPESLLISSVGATSGFGATVALKSDTTVADEVEPCTPFKTTGSEYAGGTFYKLTAAGKKLVNESGAITGNPEVTDSSAFVATNVDYFVDTIWLKLESSGSKAITVKATVTGTDEDIKGAFHVLIVQGTTVVANIDMGEAGGVSTPMTLMTGSNKLTLDGSATEGTELKVYFYLDGRDAQCKNANIKADTTLSVDLTFGLTD